MIEQFVLDAWALLALLQAEDFKLEYTIAYADAFAVALADQTGATLVSGDPELDQLHGRIKIEKLHHDE